MANAGPAATSGQSTSRRLDAVYFLAFAAVLMTAWWWSGRPVEESGLTYVPDFSMPGIELDIAVDLPYALVKFKQREAPQLDLGHERKDTESVLKDVRQVLLSSSARHETDVAVQVAAANEGADSERDEMPLALALD